MSGPAGLRWEGTTVVLDGRAVLDDVSFDVAPGRVLVLLGANGAGKSSALLAAVGVRRPTRGTVTLDGQALPRGGAALAAWRRAIGLVSQHPEDQLLAASVCEDVGFGPLQAGEAAATVSARIDEALARADAVALHDRAPHELSAGEQRRVALAGVLALRPRVLLLDEPTADLDARGAAALLPLLRRLADDGLAVVLATHDTDAALAVADDAVVLEAGRVLAAGPAPALLHDAALTARAALRPPAAAEVLAGGAGLVGARAGHALPRSVADALRLLLAPDPAWQT